MPRNNAPTLWLTLATASLLTACAGTERVTDAPPTPVAPTFTVQPKSLLATLGTSGRLFVDVTGSTPVAVQWFHNDVTIAGATLDTLLVGPITASDSGGYYAIATNAVGTVKSIVARITIVPTVSPTAWRQDGGAGVSSGRTYSSGVADESTVYVFNGGLFTFQTATITKKGASTDLAASRERGQNAAVLAASNAHIAFTTPTLTADSAGAAGYYATGIGTRISVTGGTTSTSGLSAPVIAASDGATIDVTGGTFTTAASDAIVVGARPGDAPVSITISGGAAVTAGTGVLARIESGAVATIALDGETVVGHVFVMGGGSASLVLRNATAWSGGMVGGALTLDAASTWTVTDNSAVTALVGATISGGVVTNIVGGGFTVFYDATLPANAALAGGTYALTGGGQLKPL